MLGSEPASVDVNMKSGSSTFHPPACSPGRLDTATFCCHEQLPFPMIFSTQERGEGGRGGIRGAHTLNHIIFFI